MSNEPKTATMRQLDIAFQAAEDELQALQGELIDVFQDWTNSIGVRNENLPTRRALVLTQVVDLAIKVKNLKDDFSLNVDRGA